MKTSSTLITASLLLIVALGLTATNANAETVLRFGHPVGSGGKESMDPIHTNRFFHAILPVYNKLVRIDSNGLPEPSLAESWDSSDNLTKWTFNLRQGVKFHNGSDFDAEDVVDLFSRINDPKYESPLASALALVDSVEALDAHTVVFNLASGHADFPLLLVDYRVRMTPSGHGDTIGTTGIGTGPFILEKLDAVGTTVLVRNDDYWEGAPKLDRIEIIGIPDSQARVQAMLGGQIDWLLTVSAQQAPLFTNNPTFVTQTFPSGDWKGISFSREYDKFKDPRVRKALRIVVDRVAMVALVVGEKGGTVSCDTPVAPHDQYRLNMDCPPDIEGAKRLLAEAGYPDGIDIEVSTSDMDQHWVNIAEVYQQQAATAGIRVKVNMEPPDGYWNEVWMQHPAFLSLWSSRPADQILNEAFRSGASWNESRFASDEFDSKLDMAREASTYEERARLYGEAQQILFDEGGTFIPYHLNVTRVLAKNVGGFGEVDDLHLKWHLIFKE